ncbi:hypothetical protein [Streptomyces phaeochromogenes]|uniref:hypothetical protein n=1 Tax=Streptomyces phaeochromogenes TaxID=1923 RepID=UPI002DDA63E6|nr:hypothetical protein [Streptomyces phaeochromogenes]WRZ31360.1 hypothetical protein OG931_28250 [Streptomyces phaeochromogenes]
MSGLTAADIAAARAQGDLTALLLMSSGLPVTAAPKQRAKTPTRRLPRARVGAWPDGASSPGLSPEVAAHLARLWPDRYGEVTR